FEGGAVDVEGDLGDHKVFAPALHLLEADLAAQFDAAAASVEILLDPLDAADHAAGGKIRALDERHQLGDGDLGMVNLGADAVHDFAQVVGGHVGGRAAGDPRAAVDDQVGEGRREHRRLGHAFVVIGNKVDRLFVHVLHEGGAEVGEAGLGVTH